MKSRSKKRRNGAGVNDSGDVETSLSPYETLDAMLSLYARKSSLVKRIQIDMEGMGNRSFKIFTDLPFFLPAIQEGCTFLNKHGFVHEAIQKLCARAVQNVDRFIKAMLIDDPTTCNEVCRDLMEIEALILDFSIDPTGVDLWMENSIYVPKQFNFGSIESRLKTAMGIPKDFARPSYSEYMKHSEELHPRANSRSLLFNNIDDEFFVFSLELTQHLRRVCTSLIFFLTVNTEDEGLVLRLRAELPQLDEYNALSHSYVERAKSAAEKAGFHLPEREAYKISEFPGGVGLTNLGGQEGAGPPIKN